MFIIDIEEKKKKKKKKNIKSINIKETFY